MKNIIILLFVTMACKAQNVEPMFRNTGYGKHNNIYYKDIDNDLDPYIGTWKYTTGNTVFTIVLQKKTMVPKTLGQNSFYMDNIVGEYKYEVNGSTIVNTLPSLSNNYTNMYDYNLSLAGIVGNTNHPQCASCQPNERRVAMNFNEPSRELVSGLSAGLILRRITENGVAKIVAILYKESASNGTLTDGTPTDIEAYSVPYGTYVLVKQP